MSTGFLQWLLLPMENRLVSASKDGTVRLWFLEGDKPSQILLSHEESVIPKIDIDPSGRKILVSGHRGKVFLVPLEGGSPRLLEGFSSATVVGPVAFGPSGRLAAAACLMGPVGASMAGPKEERVIRVWDLESGESRLLGPVESAGERPLCQILDQKAFSIFTSCPTGDFFPARQTAYTFRIWSTAP